MDDDQKWKRFALVPTAVLENTKFSGNSRLLYSILCGMGNKDGFSFPTQETLSRRHGAGTRSILYYLDELELEGLVERLHEESTRYRYRVIRDPRRIESTRIANKLKIERRKRKFAKKTPREHSVGN